MDLNKMLKVLLDQWTLGRNGNLFLFAFRAGAEERAYLVHPQAAKGFMVSLQKDIENYEKQYGPIDMKGYEMGIPSPLKPR